MSLCPLDPVPRSTDPSWGVSPSAPMCPTAHGDAHRGGGPAPPAGQAAAQAELVLDGVRELVHHPLAGGSGGVLGRREPTRAGGDALRCMGGSGLGAFPAVPYLAVGKQSQGLLVVPDGFLGVSQVEAG